MKLYELLITLIGAWQSSNPALAEEIDHAVPTKTEQELPTIDDDGASAPQTE